MIPEPKTRRDLDSQGCSTPGCTHAHDDEGKFIHARCHIGAGLEVEYLKGVLNIRCNRCKKMVGRIAVAP